MQLTLEQIAEQALSLPSEARARLADQLVQSLDMAADGVLGQLWAAEVVRRRDEIRRGQVQAIPGEDALARVRNAIK